MESTISGHRMSQNVDRMLSITRYSYIQVKRGGYKGGSGYIAPIIHYAPAPG